jgi:hypothetical protein
MPPHTGHYGMCSKFHIHLAGPAQPRDGQRSLPIGPNGTPRFFSKLPLPVGIIHTPSHSATSQSYPWSKPSSSGNRLLTILPPPSLSLSSILRTLTQQDSFKHNVNHDALSKLLDGFPSDLEEKLTTLYSISSPFTP